MVYKYIAIITVLLSNAVFAYAGDLLISAGVGQNILDRNGIPFERVGSIGYCYGLGPDLFIKPEAGYFGALAGDGLSSGWITSVIGVKATSQVGPQLHIGLGPSYLTTPDNIKLSGHFQFTLEGGIGMVDSTGKVSIGLSWHHISDAGIEQPNLGRDFIMVELGILNL